jgi:8-oxo-dGTP diphosphatase
MNPRTPPFAASVAIQDPQGRLLLVREGDPRVHGKYNLPGGRGEDGESPADCAVREVMEEAGLSVALSGLLGVYMQGKKLNIVFRAQAGDGASVIPGHDILSAEWLSLSDVACLPDDAILRPKKLRQIAADIAAGRRHPLDVLRQIPLEDWEMAANGET